MARLSLDGPRADRRWLIAVILGTRISIDNLVRMNSGLDIGDSLMHRDVRSLGALHGVRGTRPWRLRRAGAAQGRTR